MPAVLPRVAGSRGNGAWSTAAISSKGHPRPQEDQAYRFGIRRRDPLPEGVTTMRRSQIRNRLSVALVSLLGSALLMTGATPVSANPKPIPAGSKLQFNFNVIGYPAGKTYDGNCGDGHRIF